MNPAYASYAALTSGLFLLSFPPFWVYSRLSGRYRKGLKERLGLLPSNVLRRPTVARSPRIWIHAVSLGEVRVAEAVIRALDVLRPGCDILLSTATEHGRQLAEETLPEVPVVYAPLDVPFSVRGALRRAAPDILVFLETEIWPAWLFEARRMGIKTALVNGRISPRSIGGYLRFRGFFRQVLRNMDLFSMIRDEDARRIRDMGAEKKKIVINGNAKYDLLTRQVDPDMESELRRILNLSPSSRVFVAGSTRGGEEAVILDVYEKILKEFPDTLLFIAPRHIGRTPHLEALLRTRGFRFQKRSDLTEGAVPRREPVVVMDTFGELFKLYSVGTIIFCGASLVPLGGQNPLEPAAWGKAVFYGPSMEDFLDARDLLEGVGAGIRVRDGESFAEKALELLNDPDLLRSLGARAREAVMGNRHAAERHAQAIAGLLEG